MKKTYYPTALAGKTVAGVPNPGEGLPIALTEEQAEHALRQGYLTEDAPAKGSDDARKAKKV
ncbi:MAG: hypothetical protein EOS72_03070 [Mesorhizobium sp.]|uniref:hypothetical protein n=1 Tax=Mesorhizobium sp. TaxID=1871066 RepID=UPI000FE9C1A5|nr:hypothetical protein [Mesorhizobium sp.]RWC91651.1 MAG: hypothetical protein EOS72_03070 [Mesorhizobium sp.]